MSLAVGLILMAPLAYAGDAPPPAERNPILWLLNDIGDFFGNLSKAADAKKAEKPGSPPGPVAEKAVSAWPAPVQEAPAQTPEKTPVAAGQDTSATSPAMPATGAAQAENQMNPGNPISWLLRDLANLFTPNVTVDPGNPISWLLRDLANLFTPNVTVDPGKPLAVAETPAPAPAPEEIAAAPEAPKAAQDLTPTGDAPQSRNPLSWLFSDLAKLLSPADTAQPVADREAGPKETALDTVEKINPAPVAESVAKPVSEPASAAVEGAAAAAPAKKGNAVLWLLSDFADLFSPAKSETAETPTADVAPPAPEAAVVQAPAKPSEVVVETVAKSEAAMLAEPAAETTPATMRPDRELEQRKRNLLTWLVEDIARFFSPLPTEAEIEGRVDDAGTAPVAEAKTPARRTEITEGPWMSAGTTTPFDPQASAVGGAAGSPSATATPIMPAPAAPPSMPVSEAEPPALGPIRVRQEPDPGVRNYATTARKAREDALAATGTTDLATGVPAETEPNETEALANKIPDRMVPDEKLDLGPTAKDRELDGSEIVRTGEPPLMNADLFLGRGMRIGLPYKAADFKKNDCIDRALHGSIFCLAPLSWPAGASALFGIDTAFAGPGEGIIRFENGVVSRVYAVYNAADFPAVVKFMQQRFGPPTEREITWMHMLEAPKLPNATFRWHAIDTDRRQRTVLEVRNYDDIRRTFADLSHGMVRLYAEGSRPIFKHLSTMDLMVLQRRRAAQAPAQAPAEAAPAKAK